jgi:UDP-N-acetylmuramoyl-tripeptide--D-alanyl-D-alanine ligase
LNMTQALWTAQDAAKATGGKAQGEWQAAAVSIDSRAVKPRDLFVALPGERFDGHHFVRDALAKGAAAAMVSRIPDGVPADAPLLVVNDPQKGLEALGKAGRDRTRAKIVGVTGSVGKTSAKEALLIALSACGQTFASRGNFNNHIGTPLNLANMPPGHDFGIFEMGMNHAGELSSLTRMVRPQVAIITNVEPAHLEFFASVEAIADAKAEIFEGMDRQGTAIINLDNRHAERLRQAALKVGVGRIVTFGTAEEADCRVIECRPAEFGSEVEAVIHGTKIAYRLGAIGRHWGLMSVAVLAAAEAAGCDLPAAAAALANFREPEGRGRLARIPVSGGHATLIDDSYNASPSAMSAAFDKLRTVYEAGGGKGRKVAALGDMRELGPTSPALHRALLEPLLAASVHKVFTAGEQMAHLHDAMGGDMRGSHAPDAASLLPVLRANLLPGDIVLVKGSHGSKMYEVANALLEGVKEKTDAL